jgi:glucokinase
MSSAPNSDAAIAFPVLIGDIGGTNARFALLSDRGAQPELFHPIATADHPDIESAVRDAVFARTSTRPVSAIIDLAGPITGDAVDLTNADWVVRPRDMIAALGLKDVILLNDFEALALALTAFQPDDLQLIGPAKPGAAGAKVVLGPGTGLGVGALLEAGGLFVPVPGEGGHVSFGPEEPDEFPLWSHVEPEFGRIEAETFLCGPGIVRLYRAVARTEGREPGEASPAEVTQRALAGGDPLAVRTLALYARFLGRFAGDMALTFMARGGVYIGGGVSPHILPILRSGEFRRAFEAKAPHQAVMAGIPTWVITRDNPAMPGLSAFAHAPERYGVSLKGKRWRSVLEHR